MNGDDVAFLYLESVALRLYQVTSFAYGLGDVRRPVGQANQG